MSSANPEFMRIKQSLHDFVILANEAEPDAIENIEKVNKVEIIELPIPDWSHLPIKHSFNNCYCSPDCIADLNNEKLLLRPEYQVQYSPYFKPLLYGFVRKEFVMVFDEKKDSKTLFTELSFDKTIIYQAPCGIRLGQMENVVDYLKSTKIDTLSIENFTFSLDVRPQVLAFSDKKHVICEDFSLGKEDVKIPVVNALNNEEKPNYDYRLGYYPSDEPEVLEAFEKMNNSRSCCSCTDNCLDYNICECKKNSTKKQLLNSTNKLMRYKLKTILKSSTKDASFVCNEHCKCSKTRCLNRVVHNKINIPMELFKTVNKGWGARTLVDLPRGLFVCAYTGQIITDKRSIEQIKAFGPDADKYYCWLNLDDGIGPRKSDTSIRNLDDEEETLIDRENTARFTLDAKPGGNIAAFFNHSCDPNMQVRYFTNNHDARLPTVALFTTCYVQAGQELFWDYGYEVGTVEGRIVLCSCMSPKCRGRLL
uniref:Uncharacterized protein n=1 Tax=Acrobeloides nanus TaxID=290746 RepID=A0A914C4Y3_9BILA